MSTVPLFRPTTGDEEAREVSRVLHSGWLGTGPEVAAFEAEFAAYVGAFPELCVATNSCSSALAIAAHIAAAPKPTCPALTFVADAEALDATYHKPVRAVDVDERRLCAATHCTIHVHFAGLPAPPDAEIEDCAHAMSARLYGKHVGTMARFGCFSFHAVKNLACGDGGMLVCRNADDVPMARAMAWHGISRETHQRTDRQSYSWEYQIETNGIKGRMNDIAAAIGRVQLRHLEQRQESRERIAGRYLSELRGVELPATAPAGSRHAWHLFVVRHPDRDSLAAFLQARGIQSGVHYRPWTMYPPYRQPTPPVTERVWKTILSLPMYPAMTDGEQTRVIEAVNEFAKAGG